MSPPSDQLAPIEEVYPGPDVDQRLRRHRPGTDNQRRDKALENWKPLYDRVILLHLAGYKNTEVAALVDRTPQRISQIINAPKAQEAIGKLQKRQFKRIRLQVEERMELLSMRAVDNLADTIHANIEIEDDLKAKKHQDKVSFDMLSALGYTSKQADDGFGGIRLGKEQGEKLVKALEESDEVQDRWRNEIEVEVTETDEEGDE